MIEPVMYVGIGFLVACMLVIGIIPLVHARAVRLTMRRLEAVTPLSMAEIQADKDQLRAEFAMSTRRLEMSVEQMKAKTTSQLAELGKKSEAIGRLKLELGEKTATLFALEAKEQQLTDDLRETQQQRDENAAALQEAERLLAETRPSSRATADDRERLRADRRQPAGRARHRARADRGAEGPDRELRQGKPRAARAPHDRDHRGRRDPPGADAESAKSEELTSRVTELERQIIAQTTEAEVLGRRVQELLARLDEQGRFLAEREHTSDTLRTDASSAQQTVLDLRAELAEAENRRRARDRKPRGRAARRSRTSSSSRRPSATSCRTRSCR